MMAATAAPRRFERAEHRRSHAEADAGPAHGCAKAAIVFLGRLLLYAAVIGEQASGTRDIFSEEVDRNMAPLGINSVQAMGPSRPMWIAGQPGPVRRAGT